MDSVGRKDHEPPKEAYLELFEGQIGSSLWYIGQLWEQSLEHRLQQCALSQQTLDLCLDVAFSEETESSLMKALGTVLKAPSGVLYYRFVKQYNQVTKSIYCSDEESLETASVANPRTNHVEILRPRSPSVIPNRTLWVLETTGLGVLKSIKSLMIQNLGIPKSDNITSQWSIISISPSLEILDSSANVFRP